MIELKRSRVSLFYRLVSKYRFRNVDNSDNYVTNFAIWLALLQMHYIRCHHCLNYYHHFYNIIIIIITCHCYYYYYHKLT